MDELSRSAREPFGTVAHPARPACRLALAASAALCLAGLSVGLWLNPSALQISSQLQKLGSAGPTCPPKEWVLQDFANGHWIINTTDETSWAWYMEFLNVNKKDWPAEFHATDMHQYIFFNNASGLFYIMNHTIPATGFHLLFEADSNGKWAKNPYPVLTPAGFDPHSAKVDLLKVRYVVEEPGTPFADSCWAWRCDMPMVQNVTVDGKKVQKEFVVTFWRELVSPTEMKCTLYIIDAESGESIAPWNQPGYGPAPVDSITGKPKRLSYRFFRKTVSSFDEAQKRLPCVKSGLKGDTHEFC